MTCAKPGCKEPRHWYLSDRTGREQCRRWCEYHALEYDIEVAEAGPGKVIHIEDY